MLRINQFRVYIDELHNPNNSGKINKEEYDIIDRDLCRILDVKKAEYTVKKKSIDARKDKRLAYTYTLDVNVSFTDKRISLLNKNYKKKGITFSNISSERRYFEPVINSEAGCDYRTVIAGAGPAGLFCGYILALNGLKPVIIEQGNAMEERIDDVNKFWNDVSALNPYSNVSFGEGGAGTFSDGKLNTSVKDPSGRIDFVKHTFIENGAPEEIEYLSKPHIGTDELRNVIINLRKRIIEAGGQVIFATKLESIMTSNNRIKGIVVRDVKNDAVSQMECDILVLATGHSARDTYAMLKDTNVNMEQKDFAVGVRVMHSQDYISRNQYGQHYKMLPAADYKLRYHATNGRAVYSFCMCPGGYVVNASSEAGMTVTNGMSNHKRDSGKSNSAIVVNVTKDDFENDDVLAGVEYQRKMEKAAYEIAKGAIPAQYFSEFVSAKTCNNHNCNNETDKNEFDDNKVENNIISRGNQNITDCIKGSAKSANLRSALPEYVGDAIEEAMLHFDSQMKGFASDNPVLYGIETRTSAPVRITRDGEGESSIKGIYPCGEGAGYAGGIMSAAVDGIKIAHMIVKKIAL